MNLSPSIDPARATVGTLLAQRYRIDLLLGRSSIATVFRAVDTNLDKLVVLKVMDPIRARDPLVRKRLERELEVLSRVSHPGVARVIGLTSISDCDVLVLEWVEGETLAARLLRGRLDVDEAVALTRKASEALSACHAAGVIHRDLKPANIVLNPERGPVILDFGMAWFTSAMTLTRTGAIVGSPRYVAPELLESGHGDERVDVYGLGATLFEAVTGRPVRMEETVAEIAAGQSLPPSPRTLVPVMTRSIERAILRAIEPRPELRFFTVREFSLALAAGATAGGLEVQLPCDRCGSPRIFELSFCPGCGAEVEWRLVPGTYAVMVKEIHDVGAASRWLERRHAERITSAALGRIKRVPFSLAVGISERSALALQVESKRHGLGAEVVRMGILGPPFQVPTPSIQDVFLGALTHFVSVVGLAALGIALGAQTSVQALPFVATAVVMGGYVRQTRRPILQHKADVRLPHPAEAWIASYLSRLTTPRARGLAAGSIARVAPVLLEDSEGLPPSAEPEALEHLRSALEAAVEVDSAANSLGKRGRGDEDPLLALRHDAAVRRALESAEAITAVLSSRTLPSEV